MKPIHILALAIRLFAIALFLKSAENISTFFFMPYETKFLAYHVAGLTTLIAALLLWFFPTLVSKKIIPLNSETFSHQTLNINELYHLGFVLLGVYLLFNVFSDAVYWLSLSAYIDTQGLPDFEFLTPEHKSSITTTFFEFIIAMALIIRSKWIIALFRSHKIK